MIAIADSETLGRWVRKERKAQGLTQVQLAGLSGVGTRFLHDLEHGKTTAHLGKVIQVLQTLGLRLKLEGTSEQEGQA